MGYICSHRCVCCDALRMRVMVFRCGEKSLCGPVPDGYSEPGLNGAISGKEEFGYFYYAALEDLENTIRSIL